MVGLGLLRKSATKCLQNLAARGCSVKPLTQTNNARLNLIRGMAEKRVMQPIPSRMEWEMFKDQFHLYVMVGVAPVVAILTYANVFVGQAELADIPEDYEPEHWEYHKHPVKRWFAQYVYDKPERDYERMMHVMWVEEEKRKNRLLDWKVRDLMGSRQDYKGWYWIPTDATRIEKAAKTREDYASKLGSN